MTQTTSAVTIVSASPGLQTAVAVAPSAAAVSKDAQAYKAANDAYGRALAKLQPLRDPLPTAPYPPAGDNSNFPRTGTPALIVSQASVNAMQLAEPGKLTKSLLDQSIARRPKLNAFFAVGALCLCGYFLLRD